MELEQRVKPKQARAVKTCDRILKTAGQLLEEVGFEKFTTKILADRANLRIRSVYRYFPNKVAIIKALADLHNQKDIQFQEQFAILEDPGIHWTKALHRLVDQYYQHQVTEPGYMSVRRALNGSPELMAYDHESTRKASLKLARSLKKKIMPLGDLQLEIISSTVIEIADTMIHKAHIHLVNNDNERASAVVKELKHLLKSYLAPYFAESEL